MELYVAGILGFAGSILVYVLIQKDFNAIEDRFRSVNGGFQMRDKRIGEAHQTLAVHRKTMMEHKTKFDDQVKDFEKQVEAVQEHCKMLHEGQTTILKRQSYLRERMIPQKFEISWADLTTDKPKAKPTPPMTKKQRDELNQKLQGLAKQMKGFENGSTDGPSATNGSGKVTDQVGVSGGVSQG